MAVSDQSAEEACVAKLTHLLRRAREVDPSTTVARLARPLQVPAVVGEEESVLIPLKAYPSDAEAHQPRNLGVEGAAKRIFYNLVALNHIDDPDFVSVWDLLDILQYYSDRDLCTPQLPLALIEELLDSLSLADCRTVLTFLESRREKLIASSKGIKDKEMVILRLCNELLRRQSRAEDPVFCGRLYIFMFQSFPLGAKASVNLRGEFHVDNVTTFEDYLVASFSAENQMDIDPKDEVNTELQAKEAETKPIVSEPTPDKPATMSNEALYPVFWRLQHFFSDPPKLFKEENFKQFKEGLEATLAKFKEVEKMIQAMDSTRDTDTHESSNERKDGSASASNPKYLTSFDLFKLELGDLAFQRHILVQALIMIEFLLTLTETAKKKAYYQEAQARLQYGFTFSEENTEWALGIKNSIANYLQDGPDGKFYYRMVDTVLSRDKNWVRWKMRSCLPFARERVPAKAYEESQAGAQRAGIPKKVTPPMKASMNFQFLSKAASGKGLSQLMHNQRFVRPSPQDYAQSVRGKDEELGVAIAEDSISKLQEEKTGLTWRSLRLASIDQLNSFDGLEYGKSLESLLPATLSSQTADDNAHVVPEDRDHVPQEEDPSVEDQRADQQSQVTATAAE
ncbi:hypothetical protein P280DRAFT_183465 [Massarina eburnea CBS 473.64]|uniref:Nuclear matrix protein n=1 Tax=Massarina eburnea CBS 473.64 TaxID=1395130 RepID=A0A6A6SFA2_9PLEO|nr:hypothetical protein P280DRAFT_183465 [Massarina eburnea CBS 473.64]